ncbi:MAG: PDZ domain-containing protein [Bacteroidota bacterium]|nr:PDZ domain-containing protein [Bacteroidota bacterium]
MNKRILPVILLTLGLGSLSLLSAQTREKMKKDAEESITIRKKGDKNEKLTIVVDGDKITVNGKPLEDLKDSDIEVLRHEDIHSLMPHIRSRLAPMAGSMKMFGESANRAFLGVVSEKSDKGAKINSIEKESAAEKAGLQKDDIITKVGDTKIEGSDDLYDAIGKYKPEEKVTITYLRNGKEATTTATLGKTANTRVFSFNGQDYNFDMPNLNLNLPDWKGMNFNYNIRKPRLGLQIQDLAEGKGAKILDVDSDTPAAKAGLQKEDVITEINGKSVSSVDDLKESIKDLKEGDKFSVTFQRNGKTQTANVQIPKRLKTADL